jgi:hypothetical protein
MAPAESYKSDSRIDLEDEALDKSLEVINEKGSRLIVEPDHPSVGKEVDEIEKKNSKSKMENCKYYTSLFLGTLSIVCIFAFLFLVPFVLDPVPFQSSLSQII